MQLRLVQGLFRGTDVVRNRLGSRLQRHEMLAVVLAVASCEDWRLSPDSAVDSAVFCVGLFAHFVRRLLFPFVARRAILGVGILGPIVESVSLDARFPMYCYYNNNGLPVCAVQRLL